MKKIILTIAALFAISLYSGLYAQVRIGGIEPPHSSTVLDLNPTDANSNSGVRGVAMPRVALTGTDDTGTVPGAPYPIGLQVYNTVSRGSGSTAVIEGIYYWGGSAWLSVKSSGTSGNDAWNKEKSTVPATSYQQNIYQYGKVGIGNYAASTVGSTFEVDGAATNKSSISASSTVDFKNGNLAYSPNTTITVTGLKDGGTYTLACTASGTAIPTINISGMTKKVSVVPTSKKSTEIVVLTIVCINDNAFVYYTLFDNP
ncbi:MAG: hypothetical protein LBR13_04645 [Dysgonamonadaceae bacterium]|jgi:hypothetical protein|nr:hypothetical protein [Dysgonamonadaceae bacterium]